ncbi:nitroreductase [candidate division WOR-3 bacterium]|uniref:Nitroreductase n=1 Tax=candidate division WOR-3 bacterium TaxID=2052148 RepID=A0A9D5K8V0_UNCW3|nr:nitroreductase [candidate division WOR-3 bacterium]MBD3364220.1 nitroreductase [candidate division WOR-3 bacterium]
MRINTYSFSTPLNLEEQVLNCWTSIPIFFIINEGGYVNERFNLPEPLKTGRSIEDCLAERRSIRDFKDNALPNTHLSTLLWATQGISESRRDFRTAPSTGFPLEVFTIQDTGIHQYLPNQHGFQILKTNDVRIELAEICYEQPWVEKAPCSIVICAVPERVLENYDERGWRYIWLEAGHAAQNTLLQAVALNLGAVPVGAFKDEELTRLLDLNKEDKETVPLYIISVGVIDYEALKIKGQDYRSDGEYT